MAYVDYGALVWKNGKPFGKRENLFEDTMNTLRFDIIPFSYEFSINNKIYTEEYNNGQDFVYIGNKNIIFSFYKGHITICDYVNKRVDSIWCYSKKDIYRTMKYEFFGYKFTVKPLKANGIFLFTAYIDDDKYQVLFGYGIDPEWNKNLIPEIYGYNKKVLKFLNNRENTHYKLNYKKYRNRKNWRN